MGKLVQFEGRRRLPGEERAARAQSAEILIFTGVRYEREAPATPTKPTTTSKRKRV